MFEIAAKSILTLLCFSDVELSLQQGVYLYLGYSQKDEALLKKVTNQGALEAIGAIQGLVSYHNVNSNKVGQKCTSCGRAFYACRRWRRHK